MQKQKITYGKVIALIETQNGVLQKVEIQKLTNASSQQDDLKKFKFDLKKLPGTDFQKLVWKEIAKIPKGKTLSYSEIAQKIGKPNAVRAVASACGKNPIPLIIPCHRVVAKNGIGGFTPDIKFKISLLQFENGI